jgi:hypothetical protein
MIGHGNEVGRHESVEGVLPGDTGTADRCGRTVTGTTYRTEVPKHVGGKGAEGAHDTGVQGEIQDTVTPNT